MSAAYLGEIKMFAGNFAPRDYALCNGQLLSIAQNSALFAIVGTIYGGNGTTNFGLPDLQGRVPMHWGNSLSGAGNPVIGQVGGSQTTTLTTQQMPAHTHQLNASSASANSLTPAGTLIAAVDGPEPAYTTGSSNTQMAPTSIAAAGNNQPISLMQPYLAVTFIIAIAGIFPSRN